MGNLVEELLKTHGPCLSADLGQMLVKKHGLSPEAARKQVSRGCVGLKRLAYLPFPRNARFVYLQKDYGSPWYWKNLLGALRSTNSAYGLAVAAVVQRGGVIPTSHFPIACGAPLRQQKHLSPETIRARLVQAGVFEEVDLPGIGNCISLAQLTNLRDVDLADLRARLITESILLSAVRSWIRNLALASFNKLHVRDDGGASPKVGTFAWDLAAPSYLAPLVEWDRGMIKPKPGFIVCDVMLGAPINEEGLRPFLQKCQTLRSLKRVGRCIQLFVANSYTRNALIKAKGSGIIPATPESLFGVDVAKGLTQLAEILRDAAKASVKPEVLDELFNRLTNIEGAATNLRGALFELIAAELARQTLSPQVRLNDIYRDGLGGQAEVDVTAVVQNREVYFIECKGYQPAGILDVDDVERWLIKRIPLVRNQVLQHPQWKNHKLHFELWTTGKLSDEALAMIERSKVGTTKYTIDYKDATAVEQLAKGTQDIGLIKTLRQHFLEHPMATAERDVKRRQEKEKRASQRRADRLRSLRPEDD